MNKFDDREKSLLGESHAPRVSYLTLHHSCVLKIFLKCNRVTKSCLIVIDCLIVCQRVTESHWKIMMNSIFFLTLLIASAKIENIRSAPTAIQREMIHEIEVEVNAWCESLDPSDYI